MVLTGGILIGKFTQDLIEETEVAFDRVWGRSTGEPPLPPPFSAAHLAAYIIADTKLQNGTKST